MTVFLELNLSIIIVSLVSAIVGLPLSIYFLDESPANRLPRIATVRLALLSLINGYSIFGLAVFLVSISFNVGTAGIARPIAICLMILAIAALLMMARQNVRQSIGTLVSTCVAAVLIMLCLTLAALHVLGPVFAGMWKMAYGTGDDAARWYMVVNYFQHHPWHYGKETLETLLFPMRERPLQVYSGSILVSLVGIHPALAYSLASALAVMLAAGALVLIYQKAFGIGTLQALILPFFGTAAFFGFFGRFIDVYYTGYITHHYSLYPVFASLCFIAVRYDWKRLLLWFVFWATLLGYYYTIRYSWLFLVEIFAVLATQCLAGRISSKQLRVLTGMILLAGILSFFFVWGESRIFLRLFHGNLAQNFKTLTLQKSQSYYARATGLDTILWWGGDIGSYETSQADTGWRHAVAIALASENLLLCGCCLVFSLRKWRTYPEYAAISWFFVVLLGAFIVAHTTFLSYKWSLYVPPIVVIGAIYLVSEIWRRSFHKAAVLILLGGFASYGAMGVRQLGIYNLFVTQRYTKVDSNLLRLVQQVRSLAGPPSSGGKTAIYAYDLSAERHLLLREVFRDFDWQPVRGKDLNFDTDLVVKDAKVLDRYSFDVFLYARTFNEEVTDFSSDRKFLLYESGPFKVFNRNASLFEMRGGIVTGIYDWETGSEYGGFIEDPAGEIVFVNRGGHKELRVTLRGMTDQDFSDLRKNLTFELNDKRIDPEVKFLRVGRNWKGEGYEEFTAQIELAPAPGISRIWIRKPDTQLKLVITKAVWE